MSKKQMKFENALEELEKIVKELEGHELDLDRSIALFEKGMELSSFCHKKLREAEKKIQILMKKVDGPPELKPFVPEEQSE